MKCKCKIVTFKLVDDWIYVPIDSDSKEIKTEMKQVLK